MKNNEFYIILLFFVVYTGKFEGVYFTVFWSFLATFTVDMLFTGKKQYILLKYSFSRLKNNTMYTAKRYHFL